jgi:N-methylhydantoinase A/oxoprolinase/acetone carboxylase beta subunit
MASTTIDIDTGGTFTDAFVVHDGAPRTVKVPTTPHDLAVCFQEVIARAAEELGLAVEDLLAATASVRYSSTVGTNAVIQRTGPRIGLLVGAGREGGAAGPFVDEDMIATVNGDEALLVRSTKQLLDRSARGLVCSLPGGDAAAERAVRQGFERHYPKHCLDAVPLLLSHEIEEDPDDERRTATALFNAYVHPDVARYLYRCEDWLRDHGYQHPLLILHNDRGCARVAKTIAGKTYNSGPTAGLLGAEVIAALYDLPALLTFDVGGTSLDVAFLADGTAPLREHGVVAGVELSFAMPDLHMLGAGGGSIAHLQEGELRVGPQSAGARPGPACFAMGGTEPTVTDADVVLGIIDPDRFLGGSMKLEARRAEEALRTLGADAREVAERVRATLHENMGERISRELEARGIDASEMTTLAFGGAGPTHACGVAERIGVREVITLPFSAVFSAFGAQTTDVSHEYTAAPGEGVEERLRARALRDMRGEGFGAQDVQISASPVTRHGTARTAVRAVAPLRHHRFERYEESAGDAEGTGRRPVRWPGEGDLQTAIYDLDVLAPGVALSGPGVIEAADTTIVVPPGWEFRIDEYGNGRISRH